MKTLTPTLWILSVIAASLSSCEEESQLIDQKVNLRFTVSSGSDIVKDLPADSKLLINVQHDNGEAAMDFAEVGFTLVDNHFVTSALPLGYGNYTITDFIVTDASDEIIYAAPRSSSPLAQTTTRTSDMTFSVSSGALEQVPLRLLDAKKHKATDFGYWSFRRPGRQLYVRVALKDSEKATTAHAYLVGTSDTLASYKIAARINHILLPPSATKEHKLVIGKEGYAPVSFSMEDILERREKLLKVVLDPAFTMLAHLDPNVSSVFDFSLAGPASSSITVDWGDGTIETYELDPLEASIVHQYRSSGNYPITITGDIETITSFYSFYGQGMLDAVSFIHLRALEDIRFGLSRSPEVIDLSHNANLRSVMLTALPKLEAVHLPDEHNITSFMLEGPNRITTAALDGIIDNLYANTVNKNLTNGILNLVASVAEPEGQALVGPPSPGALIKIRALKETYQWIVSPDPFASPL